MKQEIKHSTITWLDFENPTSADIEFLQENFNVHPLAIEEFITPTLRPKATIYENCLFMTVHIPLYDVEARTTYAGEVDIILTKDHLITGHFESIYQFDEFFQEIQGSIGKQRLYMEKTPAHLLFTILEILLDSCFPKLDNITRKIETIEKNVFGDNEKKMVKEISYVKRDILNFRRTLMPQRSVLESLTQKENPYIPKDLVPYYHDLIGTNIRLWNTLQSNKETIESLEETNDTLLSHKINEKMRVLTIFSAVLVPLSFYANLISMNTKGIPLEDSSAGFLIHVGIMILVVLFTLGIFKWRKWF